MVIPTRRYEIWVFDENGRHLSRVFSSYVKHVTAEMMVHLLARGLGNLVFKTSIQELTGQYLLN